MRKAGAIVIGLVVLALAFGAVLVLTLEPNDHKDTIARWASEALGSKVEIGGPIELTPSLTPSLVVNDLSIGGGAGDAGAIAIGRAEVSLVLSSLLFGPLHLPVVSIDTADLNLPLSGSTLAGGDGDVPRIDQINLANIEIRYASDNGRPFTAVIEHATFAPGATGTDLEVTGKIGEVPVHLAGTAGTVAALFAGSDRWPVDVDGTLGEGKLGFRGDLDMKGSDLLFTLDSRIDLPASTAQALQIPALALQASTRLQGDPDGFRAQGLDATYGSSDLQGDLTWQQGGPRPKLSGTVTSRRIVLAELVSTGGGRADDGAGPIPNPPMLLPAMMPMDLDITASVAQFDLAPSYAATDLAIKTSGTEQALELALTQAKVGPGQVQANYGVDSRGTSSDIALKLDIKDFDLTYLFGPPGGRNKLPQDVDVALDLTGRGDDLHAFLGSASGPIAITTGEAVIDDAFVNLLGRSLFTAIIPDLHQSKGAHILCTVLDLEAKDGKARSTAFVVDGKHVVVGGGGAIELATGKIDFVLLPTAKDATLAPLVAPVHLTGTITDPQVMDDAADILKSTSHLLLGIVNPLSLATPMLHPDRRGMAPCRDPAAFAHEQEMPGGSVGQGAADVIEGVGHGIGKAVEDLGKGASDLLEDLTGQ